MSVQPGKTDRRTGMTNVRNPLLIFLRIRYFIKILTKIIKNHGKTASGRAQNTNPL
jgi:hypothetical protein